ncbi:MAG: zinc-ribbon domain-containing protein, partial [Ktedonobacterales bacterium]
MMESFFDSPAGNARCPTCGSQIDSHATICAACGTPLAAPVMSPEPEASQSPPEIVPMQPPEGAAPGAGAPLDAALAAEAR